MGITVTPIENPTQWQSLRRGLVGASEAGALCGVHEYISYYGLWARKSGKIPPEPDNPAMERGRRLEPVAIEVIRERYPNLNVVRPNEHYADQTYGIGATPDLLAHDPERGQGSIQIKSVAPSVFRRGWFGDTDVCTPPTWIMIQAVMEAELTGSKWCAVAALVVDHHIDLHLIDVPMHQGIIETVKSEALKFWKLVLSGREPDPDYARDGELIRAMLRTEDGSEIDLSGVNDLPDLLDQREAARAVIKGCEDELSAIDGRLLHMLGEHAIGRFNGGYISAKTINRKAHEVKASSFRQLRVVRDK